MINYIRSIVAFTNPLFRDIKILASENFNLLLVIFLIQFVSGFTAEYHEYIMYMALGLAIKEKSFANFIPYVIQYPPIRFFVVFIGFIALVLYGFDIFSYFNPPLEESKPNNAVGVLELFAILVYISVIGLIGSFLTVYVIFTMYTVSYNSPEYLSLTVLDITSFFKKRFLWLFMWWPTAISFLAAALLIAYIKNDYVTKVLFSMHSTFMLYYCSTIVMRYIFNKPPKEPDAKEKQYKTVEAM